MKKDVKKIITRLKKMMPGRSVQVAERRVTVDWFRVLGISVVLGLVLCGVGVYVFFFRGANAIEKEMVDISQVTFESGRLRGAIGVYEARSSEFSVIRLRPPMAPKTGLPETPTESLDVDEEQVQPEIGNGEILAD